jgi:hypothetical protein
MELKAFAEQSGVHKVLRDAGLTFNALEPRWTSDAHEDVVFFLNPSLRPGLPSRFPARLLSSTRANYGWVSIQDLHEWAEGRGPIVDGSDTESEIRKRLSLDETVIRAEQQLRKRLNDALTHALAAAPKVLGGFSKPATVSATPVQTNFSGSSIASDDPALAAAVAEAGLDKRLSAAGLIGYILKPRWLDNNRSDVIFYLNPAPAARGQKKPNMGWVTVQDLLDWADGSGPVVDGDRSALYLDACQERARKQTSVPVVAMGR